MSEKSSPPKLFLRFFRWFCHPKMQDYIEGDLMEMYEKRLAKYGRRVADLKFIMDVLFLFRTGIIRTRGDHQNLNTYGMLENYLKISWRNIIKNKSFSIINILGLSAAMAVAMLIILFANDEASYDRFHLKASRIYRLGHQRLNPDGSVASMGGNSGYLQGPTFSDNIPEIETFTRLKSYDLEIRHDDNIFRRPVHFVDTSFFRIFSFPFIEGKPESALRDPNSVILSESVAQSMFGDADPVGKVIEIKKAETFQLFTVTGVAKNAPDNSSIQFELIAPMVVVESDIHWFNYFLNTFVLLRPGVDLKSVEQKIRRVYEQEAKAEIRAMEQKFNDKTRIVNKLQPFTDIHLSQEYSSDNGLVNGSDPVYSYILSAIALFILAVACINFVNLTIARSIKRAREVGVRKVVGSRRQQLIAQFLTESYLICLAAFTIAILLVQLILPSFNELSNKILRLSYLLEVKNLVGYAILLLLTGLTAGLYPSLVLSGYNTVKALKNNLTFGRNGFLQRGLVVLQFAIATLMIVGTVTIFHQFTFLSTQPLGYDASNVVQIPKRLNHREARLLKRELEKSLDVLQVSVKNGGREGTVAKINGDQEIGFDYETVDDHYLELYKISLVQGRNFSVNFPADSNHSVLVNETFVKLAGWKDPIGQRVNFWYRNEIYSVIGIVKNYHFQSLKQESGPQLFTTRTARDYGLVLVRIVPGRSSEAIAFIEQTFKKFYPESFFQYRFKEEENYMSYALEAKWRKMMMAGALVTIFLSSMGLFGLTVLAAERKTKEIGIRKVLGASVGNIAKILSADFMRLVLVASILSLPVAYYGVNKWLDGYVYRIKIEWSLFVIPLIIVMAIAIMTIGFQVLKSAFSNPVSSLKYE